MIGYGITYRAGDNLNLIGYVDSDFAGCKDTRRSTEGMIFIVAGGPVSWESKRQDTVALSVRGHLELCLVSSESLFY